MWSLWTPQLDAFWAKFASSNKPASSAPDLSIASHSVTKLLECAKCLTAKECVDLAIWQVEIMFHIVTKYCTLNVTMLLHQFQTPLVHVYRLNCKILHVGDTFIQSNGLAELKHYKSNLVASSSQEENTYLLKLSSMNWWRIYQYELFSSGTALPYVM